MVSLLIVTELRAAKIRIRRFLKSPDTTKFETIFKAVQLSADARCCTMNFSYSFAKTRKKVAFCALASKCVLF